MWAQAGFRPDDFWRQTPLHFQIVMQGVRKRLENEQECRTALAYESGAFAGLAHHGKLKALSTYVRKAAAGQSSQEALANMRIVAARVNKKFKAAQEE